MKKENQKQFAFPYQEKDFFKNLLDHSFDGIYFVDSERKILYWNKGAEAISGYRGSEVTGSYCHDHVLQHTNKNGKNLCLDGCPLLDAIREDRPVRIKYYLHHRSGKRVPVESQISPVKNAGGDTIGAIATFRDVVAFEALEKANNKIKKLIGIDPLTRVANRRKVFETLKQEMIRSQRYHSGLSMIMVDIDHFKKVNDRHGHLTGDRVLKAVAKILKRYTRKSDLVGRYGGEEFLLILPQSNKKQATIVAEKLRAAISAYRFKGLSDPLHASFGVTVLKRTDDLDELVARVDSALYQAKKDGRNRVCFL